jgi:hypothetical protein
MPKNRDALHQNRTNGALQEERRGSILTATHGEI